MPEGGAAEVGDVVTGFNRMAGALEHQREALEDHQAELEAQTAELQEALGSLEERNAHIELVRSFGDEMVAEGSSVETVAVAALRGMGDGARCEIGAVYLHDPEGESYVAVATRGVLPSDIPSVIGPGETLAGRAVAAGRPISASRGDTSLQTGGLVGAPRALHELHVPIRHGEQTLGVVSLARERDEPFSEADLQLSGDLAERTAAGLRAGARHPPAQPNAPRSSARCWRRSTRGSTGSTRPDG